MPYLFDLNALNGQGPFLIKAIKEVKLSSFHYWMLFLCDLITLRKVRIIIVFPVKLNSAINMTTEGERCLNSKIQTLFIQNRQHAWKG